MSDIDLEKLLTRHTVIIDAFPPRGTTPDSERIYTVGVDPDNDCVPAWSVTSDSLANALAAAVRAERHLCTDPGCSGECGDRH